MTTTAQNMELARQLRSLTIVREDSPAATAVQAEPANGRVRKPFGWRAGLLLGLAIVVGGLGYGVKTGQAEGWVAQVAALLPQKGEAAKTDVAAAPNVPPPAAAPLVAVTTPAVIGSGYVIAEREVVLRPQIGGRVARLDLEVGDRFAQGQVLAELDDTAATTAVQIATLELALAKQTHARLRIKQDQMGAEVTRLEKLVAKGAVASADLDAARFDTLLMEQDVLAAASAIEVARLQLTQSQQLLVQHRITAPFDGVVVERQASLGDIVASGLNGDAPGIAVLLDTSALAVEVDVSENNLRQLSSGQIAAVTLDAYPDQTFEARVSVIAAKVSAQKGTVAVRLKFTKPPGDSVLANMSAKVSFEPAAKTAELISKGN